MKFIAAILLTLLTLGQTVSTKSWEQTVAQVKRSVVRIAYEKLSHAGEAACTAFVINSEKRYAMTATHCLHDTMFVDDKPAVAVFSVPALDVSIIEIRVFKPALVARTGKLKVGEEVAALGYGYGMLHPLAVFGRVSTLDMVIDEPDAKGAFLTMDRPVIMGMSGGPIFDSDGRVVAVAQRSDNRTGSGQPMSTVFDATVDYWQ